MLLLTIFFFTKMNLSGYFFRTEIIISVQNNTVRYGSKWMCMAQNCGIMFVFKLL